MSKCKYCGTKVSWIKRPEGGWFPPFEYDALFEIRDYNLEWNGTDWVGTASPGADRLQVRAVRHYCDRAAAIQQEQEESEPEPIIQYRTVPQIVIKIKQPSHEQLIALALRLQCDCPVCYAQPFDWCTSVNDPETEIKVLHTKRGSA